MFFASGSFHRIKYEEWEFSSQEFDEIFFNRVS